MLRCHILAGLMMLLSVPLGAAELDQPFVLAPGQSEAVGATGLVVGFTEIIVDSRCPADVVCVWGGDVEVALFAERPGAAVDQFVLHTFEDWPRAIELGAWRIALLGVTPYPQHHGVPIAPADYRVTLEVTSAGVSGAEPVAWAAAKARYR